MMKKIFIFILVLIMTFNLAACGSKEDDASSGKDKAGSSDINIVDHPAGDINIVDQPDTYADFTDETDEYDNETQGDETLYADQIWTIENYTTILFQKECTGTYVGELNEDGIPDGSGTMTGSCTTSKGSTTSFTITGTFADGYASGYGDSMETFAEDHTRHYEGNFANGCFNGNGKYTEIMTGNKETYEGEFKDGKREGSGTMTLYISNGDLEQCVGEFLNNEFTGQGNKTLIFSDEHSAQTGISQVYYEGTFVNCMMTGSGNTQYVYYSDGQFLVRTGLFSSQEEFVSGTESLYDSDGVLIYSYDV